jgi:hypothetical protein
MVGDDDAPVGPSLRNQKPLGRVDRRMYFDFAEARALRSVEDPLRAEVLHGGQIL